MNKTFSEKQKSVIASIAICSNSRSRAMLDDSDTIGVHTLFWNGTQMVWKDTATAIELVYMNVPAADRGQGHGTHAMEHFLKACDKTGVRIVVRIRPTDVTYQQRIADWFDGLGFTMEVPNSGEGAIMSRMAKRTIPTPAPLKAFSLDLPKVAFVGTGERKHMGDFARA